MKSNNKATQVAFSTANHISAMVAYWDINQTCIFSNDAHQQWFGKSPEQMRGMTIIELLGPAIYKRNLPHLLAVLKGKKQVFERQITDAAGVLRQAIFTYTPDAIKGRVWGFTVHGADVTVLREREAALEKAIRYRNAVQAELRILRGLPPICSFCKSICEDNNQWRQPEGAVNRHSETTFTPGICPKCVEKHYGKTAK